MRDKLINSIYPIIVEQAMSGEYIHIPMGLTNKLINAIITSFLKPQQLEIFNIIIFGEKSTREISIILKIPTKNISTQCRQMSSTGIIKNMGTSKNPKWKIE